MAILALRVVAALLFLIAGRGATAKAFVESSQEILLPPEVREPLRATSTFPVFWWNFLVLQTTERDLASPSFEELCADLRAKMRSQVRLLICGQDIGAFLPIAREWVRDQFLRHPAPDLQGMQKELAQAQVKASLPLDTPLFHLLRMDPFFTIGELKELLISSVPLSFKKVSGAYFDSETQRALIPFQADYPPSDVQKTKTLFSEMEKALSVRSSQFRWLGTIGPQASTFENTERIMKDVEGISWIGLLLMFVQVLIAFVFHRWRLVWLVPPVLISTAFSAFVTFWVFGSIHGLTLAFGPGIVALAMDHGLHSCFNPRWRGAWRANIFGLLTTIVALVTILFSSIPFLRQLMFFAIIGLCSGFFVYWWLHTRWPQIFSVQPFSWQPRRHTLKTAAVLFFLAGSLVGLFRLRPDFSMQQMDFQAPLKRELMVWFFSHMKSHAPLLQIFHRGSPLDEMAKEQAFAASQGISLRSAGAFLPHPSKQMEFYESWRKRLCHPAALTSTQIKLFEPFFSSYSCEGSGVQDLKTSVPLYVADLTNGIDWIGLWLPQTEDQIQTIKIQTNGALSLPEIVGLFPNILSRELRMMAPLSLLFAVFLLWVYYRDLYLAGLALVPFLCGMGVYSWCAILGSFKTSFVSFIAVIMVFGLSLDYGIFAANLYRRGDRPAPEGVWTSIGLAASVTFLGFLPLLFCEHPVLVQLGQVLVYGTAGTILGSMWGVPVVDHLLGRRGLRA